MELLAHVCEINLGHGGHHHVAVLAKLQEQIVFPFDCRPKSDCVIHPIVAHNEVFELGERDTPSNGAVVVAHVQCHIAQDRNARGLARGGTAFVDWADPMHDRVI